MKLFWQLLSIFVVAALPGLYTASRFSAASKRIDELEEEVKSLEARLAETSDAAWEWNSLATKHIDLNYKNEKLLEACVAERNQERTNVPTKD